MMEMPDDFQTVALNLGVGAIQQHYRCSYNTALRWLHALPDDLQQLRRIAVPMGRKGGQAAIARDDTTNINASDRMARQSAESSTLALEARYIKAAATKGGAWRVWEYRRAEA